MVAAGQEGGSVPHAREILLVDSLAAAAGAASTALVVVGFLMMLGIRTIDWTDYEIAIPAFLTIVIMPFTYSISHGIGAGLISYVLIKLVVGKAREVHPLLWGWPCCSCFTSCVA